ncbi:MAG: hypothetical protein IJ251_05980 [Oscillospiraceae bacterium]|nr:hypothetical protein [Oscillospiraceae bacterium]
MSEQAVKQYSEASTCHAKAESRLEQAKEKLAELHTELLPRSEVGSDFERRIKECNDKLAAAESEDSECSKRLNDLEPAPTFFHISIAFSVMMWYNKKDRLMKG